MFYRLLDFLSNSDAYLTDERWISHTTPVKIGFLSYTLINTVVVHLASVFAIRVILTKVTMNQSYPTKKADRTKCSIGFIPHWEVECFSL
jgi:hypothetical protein